MSRSRRSTLTITAIPLFWRVCAINGVVFATAVAALAFTPATVSYPVGRMEEIILVAGLVIIVGANAALLRSSLLPFDRLIKLMTRVDLLRPDTRLPKLGDGVVASVVASVNAMLERLESERAQRASQSLAAQESERSRIAKELHDEVGQSLTVVLLGLKRIADQAPPLLKQDIDLVRDAARNSLDEVRHVVTRLRPGVLEELGLRAAMQALAEDMTRLTAIKTSVTIDPILSPLPESTELALYRIAQESLTNTVRHSGATHAQVELTTNPEGVRLTVADNGHGIGQAPEGVGISGMRERALLINSRLEILASPDGTTIILTTGHED